MFVQTESKKVLLSDWEKIPQKSEKWYKKRNSILTATDVPIILEVSPFKTKYELFQEKLNNAKGLCNETKENKELNNAILWGEKYEPFAKKFYEVMPLANGPRRIHEVGLIEHSDYPWLGASPDGLVEGILKKEWWLLEVKCPYSRSIHEKTIPLYIWVQVQIQMEVCDLSFCHLLECCYEKNETKEVNKLLNRRLTTIQRDKNWFKNIAFPCLEEFWFLLQRGTYYQFFQNPYPNPEEWVSMNSFTGYLLQDPILDWLNYLDTQPNKPFFIHSKNEINENKKKEKKILYSSLKNNFEDFCNSFSYKMKTVTPLEEGNRESFSLRRFEQTKEMLKEKIPVIFRPVLMDIKKKIYGVPDLLVRCDVAYHFLQSNSLNSSEIASNNEFLNGYVLFCFSLRNANTKMNPTPLEVKNKRKKEKQNINFNLRRSKRLMKKKWIEEKHEFIEDLNKNSKKRINKWEKVLIARYSGYCDIVDSILEEICDGGTQNIPNTMLVILGSCFSHLVDFETVYQMKKEVKKSAEWVRKIKKESNNWLNNLGKNEYPDNRLMPNMCNKFDGRWRIVKKQIGEKWGEMTLLWYCGMNQRKNAHEKGIYSWKDTKYSPEEIVSSFYKSKKSNDEINSRRNRIITSMIRLNRSENKVFDSYAIKELPEPFYDNEKTKSFFVDFEVFSNKDNNKNISERLQRPESMIYLIGMGWIDDKNGEWKFRSFVAKSLTVSAENYILREWWDTIKTVKRNSGAKKGILYHWSPAEPRFFQKVMKRNPIDRILDDLNGIFYEWRDLMDMFLEAEVVIRGVWGYSIKDVAKGLYEHGLIQEIWENGWKGNMNGENSMVTATNCYKQSIKMGIPINKVPNFENLRIYNHMDCKLLYDLLCFLRNYIYSGDDIIIPSSLQGSKEIWGKKKIYKYRKRKRENPEDSEDSDNGYDNGYNNRKKRKIHY
jgi:putative phage-type endonuclease